jgi:hypothetical protein
MGSATLPETNPESYSAAQRPRFAREGLVSGGLGGSAIALWFLLLDAIRGRPLYTPSVLGTAIFHPDTMPTSYEALPVSAGVAAAFTLIHFVVFALIGIGASWLLFKAEKNPNLGFGIILLFVIFESCFVALATLFAEPALKALTWPAILVANFLAATVMAIYFWKRHPKLTILP